MKRLLLTMAASTAFLSTQLIAADLTYSTYGGFVPGTDSVDGLNYAVGQNDQTQDGPWYREGPFSEVVLYGDITNGNMKDARDPNGGYPALTWGHVEQSPWVSAGGEGDDLGGASGMGSIAYDKTITLDDNTTFYPILAVEHRNNSNSFIGTLSATLSWNVELYDDSNTLLYNKNFVWGISQWETVNLPTYCPRDYIPAGEVVNDLQFSIDGQTVISPSFPTMGQDINFTSDGVTETGPCSDAVALTNVLATDTFTDGTPDQIVGEELIPGTPATTEYTISFSGFYVYLDDTERPATCPALGADGMPDASAGIECFKETSTLWSSENDKATGFLRMSISSKVIETDDNTTEDNNTTGDDDNCTQEKKCCKKHGSHGFKKCCKKHGKHGSKKDCKKHGSHGSKKYSKKYGKHGSKKDCKKDGKYGSKKYSKKYGKYGSKKDCKKDGKYGSKKYSKKYGSHGSKKYGKSC